MPVETRRIEAVDALRGICALAVVLYHYTIRYDALVGFSGTPNPAFDLDRSVDLRHWGMFPVYVFFIISGFVISMTLSRVKTVGEFALARFSRTYPAYWVAVIVTYIAWRQMPLFPTDVTLLGLAANLTMLQEYFYVPHVDGVYWSLTAELSFYVAIGLLFATGHFRRWLRPWCFGWLGLSMLHGAMGDQFPLPFLGVLALNLKHAHLFVAGIVFYEIWSGNGRRIDAALLALCAVSIGLHYPLRPALALICVLGLFLAFALTREPARVPAVLRFLGAISYSLYLIHQMIGYQLISLMPFPPAVRVVLCTAIAIAVAAAITFLVERPAQRYLRGKRKRPDAVTDPQPAVA